jgi:hypothetical protein
MLPPAGEGLAIGSQEGGSMKWQIASLVPACASAGRGFRGAATWATLILLAMPIACATIPDQRGKGNQDRGGYTPIDPLPVKYKEQGTTRAEVKAALLSKLPDSTMRLAIVDSTLDTNSTYGVATLGTKNRSYQVILDYIQYTTKSFALKKVVDSADPSRTYEPVKSMAEADIHVPVYIGFGVRLTANVYVNEGTVNLGSLFALGVAAEAKQISGTLIIQSLGLSGAGVAAALPIPSEINATTIQSALMAIGTMKAKIYDPEISCTPRVVAILNPFGNNSDTLNGFITALLGTPIDLDNPTQLLMSSAEDAVLNEPSDLSCSSLEADFVSGAFGVAVDDEEPTLFVLEQVQDSLRIRALLTFREPVRDLEAVTWCGGDTYIASTSFRQLGANEANMRKLIKFDLPLRAWERAGSEINGTSQDVSQELGRFLHENGVVVDTQAWGAFANAPSGSDKPWHPYALEIEGLACDGGEILLGLKWPLDPNANALIVGYDWDSQQCTRLVRLDLAGQGISSLAPDAAHNQILVVSNPPAKERDGNAWDERNTLGLSRINVFDWPLPKADQPLVPKKSVRASRGGAKLEGLTIAAGSAWLAFDGPTHGLFVKGTKALGLE